MGLFGTSKVEEDNLRQIAQQNVDDSSRRNSRDTFQSLTASSAYETAEEDNDDLEEFVHPPDDDGDDGAQIPSAQRETKLASDDIVQQAPQHEPDHEHPHITQPNTEQPKDQEDDATIDALVNEKSLNNDTDEKIYSMHQLQWDSDDDPHDPMNWKPLKKWYVTMTTAFICLCVSLGSSLYVSGTFEIMAATGASRELVIAGLSLYLLGLSLGPALGSPISETFGRRIVYVTSFPLSMLFTMGVGLSNEIYQILILRFFSGLFASPALAVAGGTINDIWRAEDRGMAAAIFILSPFMGPSLGPVIGNFAAEYKGWKWTMWVSLMFSGSILIPVLLLPETYKPILLLKRAKQRGIELHVPSTATIIKGTLFATLLKPVEMLMLDAIVFFWSFYIAFVFAVLFGFFEAFPIIFQGQYQMDLGVSGLTFIGVGVGLLLGVLFYIILDFKIFFPVNADGTRGKRDENGKLIPSAPEGILKIGKIGAICLPVSLFWLGWTGRSSIHWIVPTLSGVPFGFGLILIFFTNIMYFAFSFPPSAVASALGANNLLRYLFASAFPLFTTQMYEKLKIGWATSIFAFISLALLPIPWIFEKLGPRLRAKSRFGYASLQKQQPQQLNNNNPNVQQDEQDLSEVEQDVDKLLDPSAQV